MNWVFSKLLRSKSTNQEIRLGNQNEFSGVISPNKPIAVTNEPVEFTSTVDLSNADVVGLPFYTTEIAAIDAGLAFGDKYVDSDGVIQTVTKIKQTITLPAGVQTIFGFLIDLDSLDSQDILDVLPEFTGSLSTYNEGGVQSYITDVADTIVSFTNGRGYIAIPSTAYSITLYGSPLSSEYHTNLSAGTNVVVHNAETTDNTTATTWVGSAITTVLTAVGGVQTVNPTTWVKGQGYLLSGVGSPQAALGSPSTPVPLDITGEQIVALLTAENYDPRSYKVYTALLSQTGANAPTAIVLENTLGGTVVWTRGAGGSYTGTLTGVFTINKTYIEAKTMMDDSGINTAINISTTLNTVTITNMGGIDLSSAWPGAVTNTRYQIEIRVYN